MCGEWVWELSITHLGLRYFGYSLISHAYLLRAVHTLNVSNSANACQMEFVDDGFAMEMQEDPERTETFRPCLGRMQTLDSCIRATTPA